MHNKVENKTILVTGGAGFIGSYVVEELLLLEPAKIIILDNLIRGSMENMRNFIDNANLRSSVWLCQIDPSLLRPLACSWGPAETIKQLPYPSTDLSDVLGIQTGKKPLSLRRMPPPTWSPVGIHLPTYLPTYVCTCSCGFFLEPIETNAHKEQWSARVTRK